MYKKFLIGACGSLAGVALLVGSSAEAACSASLLGPNTFGQSGQSVTALQQCLIDAGHNIPAGATGYYGEQTRSAVRAFYASSLAMLDWDGNSVGPIGREKLVAVAAGVGVTNPVSVATATGYKTLTSADELKKYLETESGFGMVRSLAAEDADTVMAAPVVDESSDAGVAPTRVSETNVQVVGVDEPDIVKTDGQSIFVSGESRWYGWTEPMLMPMLIDDTTTDMIGMPPYNQPDPTKVVDAYPVDDLAVISEAIEERGEMLLVKDKDILVIFSQPKIVAYDVSSPKQPKKKWEKELENDTSIVTSRLLDGTVYLVTQTYLNQYMPCPVVPLSDVRSSLSIPCGSILVPEQIEPVSHLYSVLKLDPTDGSVNTETSVAGDYSGMTVMMSLNNLYLASPAQAAEQQIMLELTIEVAESYLPAETIAKARTIVGYDISNGGKYNEVILLFQSYLNTLGGDEQLRIQNEMENLLSEKIQEHQRDLYRTRIVRIGLESLAVEATGIVPGHLLNQFAMDEYEDHLRVAVTVGNRWGWRGSTASANDVYVLSISDMMQVGVVTDLGLSERIYAIRFMGDEGYMVTFRETDPFYVLDLSQPTAPNMVGELKIPGYSAYLEYLGNDLVLGVGREDDGVKMSIFDVSDPSKPVERSKYQLKDYWSEVESNHHAFLRDAKHEVFFIPGGEGGYVFSYAGGKLKMEKAISGYSVKRALYIDDYLYVVSDDRIRVFDEADWDEVKEIML